jgi:hypothetical protein
MKYHFIFAQKPDDHERSKQTPRDRLRRPAGVAPLRGSGEAAAGVGD